jgi:melibiose permease/lactose/raffinose/galactose permease
MNESMNTRRNRWTFGIGTIGRDMLYTLISMYLIYYFTSVLHLPTSELAWVTSLIVGLKVIDVVADPLIGMVVDNTRTRWGKHKPWILVGALLSGVVTIFLFADSGAQGAARVAVYAVLYLLWAGTYALNDIAYWSYIPALSQNQKEREKIGARARIFALIGTFFVVATIEPLTGVLGGKNGDGSANLTRGYFLFAVIVAIVLWAGQSVTLFGVKETHGLLERQEHTTFRDFLRALFRNDQLLYVAGAMALMTIGFTVTTSFGLFYFQYVYGNTGDYPLFAIILGVSQISALIAFPILSRQMRRKSIYLWSTILVVAGYIVFFFAPTGTLIVIGIGGVLMFVGQGAQQLLMMLSLADTVDYGHWKLGKRNESVTFSLQPFINKAGGAAATGITGFTAIIVGLNTRADDELLVGSDLVIFKVAMLLLPLACIVGGYLVFHKKYRIDEEEYANIHSDLVARGELVSDAEVAL